MRQDYAFDDGLFSGYDEAGRKYDKSTWTYELGPDGYAKVDPTLQDPRCVFQLLKKHFARYTPEVVSSVTGAKKEEFLQVCKTIATTAVPDRTMTSLRARLDPAGVGSQNHPRDGDDPAPPGSRDGGGGGVAICACSTSRGSPTWACSRICCPAT